MEPISVQYRLTEPEFMSACNAHWSASRQGTTVSNLTTGIISAVIGFVLLASMFWLAFLLVLVGAILLIFTYARSLLWKRAFREAKKYNDNISVIFDDDAVYVESAEGESSLKWSFFSSYLDTSDYVLLYMTKRTFSVIPKAAFQNKQLMQQFEEIVKSKLKRIR